MTLREFQEWQEYYKLEPFGDDWLQAGTIAAASVTPWTKKKINPERFIPKAKTRQTPQEIEAQMNAWARTYNKRLSRNGDHRQN